MSAHWTYDNEAQFEDLKQGDILIPPSLADFCEKIQAPKLMRGEETGLYGFLVTSQSCDLARRGGSPPRASHIGLAPIKALKQCFYELLSRHCRPVAPNVFRRSHELKARDFLSRLFNQQEERDGLFYLHDSADQKLAEPCVAILREQTAVGGEHYEVLLEAASARLTSLFRARLGWLVGNIYNRVGTNDWTDDESGSERIRDIADDLLTSTASDAIHWESDAAVEAAESKVQLFELTTGEALEAIEEQRPPSSEDAVLNEVRRNLTSILKNPELQVDKDKGELVVDRLVGRLRASKNFNRHLRED